MLPKNNDHILIFRDCCFTAQNIANMYGGIDEWKLCVIAVTYIVYIVVWYCIILHIVMIHCFIYLFYSYCFYVWVDTVISCNGMRKVVVFWISPTETEVRYLGKLIINIFRVISRRRRLLNCYQKTHYISVKKISVGQTLMSKTEVVLVLFCASASCQ